MNRPIKNTVMPFFVCLAGFIVPISFEYDFGPIKANLPIEPVIACLGIVLVILLIWRTRLQTLFKPSFNKTIVIYASILIMTSIVSTMPIVSFKYITINLLHIIVFYFGFYLTGKDLQRNVSLFMWGYMVGLALVLLFFWSNFYGTAFNHKSLVVLAQPFYKDNTIFSASLSMILPWILTLRFQGQLPKWFSNLIMLIVLATIIMLNCRAAWLGLISAAVLVMSIKYLSISFKYLLVTITLLVLVTATLLLQINAGNATKSNETGKTGDKLETIRSMSNLHSDVSNLERINRYKCAIRMFGEKPILGFGPGTFQYAYLPFQIPEEMTRLSIPIDQNLNNYTPPNGRGGGAHSEYLQALSEMGLLGFASWIAIIMIIFQLALSVYDKVDFDTKNYVLAAIFGLTTFLVHGLFNNFLHQEEISSLFWMSTAVLCQLQQSSH